MDVFCSRLPQQISHAELQRLFTGPLHDCGVHDFHIEKLSNKGLAIITILDANAGRLFVQRYAVPRASPHNQLAPMRISYARKFIRIEPSNREPTDVSLHSLQYNANQRIKALLLGSGSGSGNGSGRPDRPRPPTGFRVNMLQCGSFDYPSDAKQLLRFLAHFTLPRQGTIHFGEKQAIAILGPEGGDQLRVDLPYRDCIDIVLGTHEEPSIAFALTLPPKLYEINKLAASLLALSIGQKAAAHAQQSKKTRIPAIDGHHAKIAGSCFVYRLHLSDHRQLSRIKTVLSRGKMPCSVLSVKTRTEFPGETLENSFTRLNYELSDTNRFGAKPFRLRYQVDRLARNGYLPPQKVILLLPKISELFVSSGLEATLSGLRRFSRSIPYPGPTVEAVELATGTLEERLHECVTLYNEHAPDNPFELAKRHVHINLIHKVIVTPAGIRLEGPEPEPTNRVLRKYAENIDDFLRVVFQDEHGGPVRYDPRSDLTRIYHERFQKVLDTNIVICGRGFSFLGFSHSSLRSQSCWFMAPFVNRHGRLIFAEKLLKGLGDFSSIQTPAKCAARIGQNFTDTNATVRLEPGQVFDLQVVERNGRDFSDGVGTISEALLREVWRRYGTRKMLKPTVLQIRFQGAKGMVSLDPRLPGKALMLRANMRKYDTETSWMLEICGAGFKPLPMVLNQQFIKIFEDLGIPTSVFLDLQTSAVKHLRHMTGLSVNSAKLLEDSGIARGTGIPRLIRDLSHIGFDYHEDHFLYSVVEMAVVTKLRDIKYRAREYINTQSCRTQLRCMLGAQACDVTDSNLVCDMGFGAALANTFVSLGIPMEDGVTLYGIMDETGYLQENQIFVITEKAPEGGKQILVKRNVVITRSPAMHPGDIQVVDAIDVPLDSILRRLANVVVFSKWGQRDLPSMLSGGDLDGDRKHIESRNAELSQARLAGVLGTDTAVQSLVYNIIWHEGMVPRTVYTPADYQRVDPLVLDREVKIKDMSDFFVTFMETDLLGMICTTHKQLADQRDAGSLDPDCIKLASLASTAVDYSKTGIAVNHKQIPRNDKSRFRPDFMAPTPRVVVSGEGLVDLEEEEEADDDAFEGLDSERRPYRYYESKKTLGHLYRDIDETQFLRTMQQEYRAIAPRFKRQGTMTRLLAYLKQNAVNVFWTQHTALASDIRSSFDDSLADLLYEYEPTPHHPLSETEAFSGQILGRQSGPQGKPLRELTKTMTERFEMVVEHARMRIRFGDAVEEIQDIDDLHDPRYHDRDVEALPRAIACLHVALSEAGYQDRKIGELKSFKYIAAQIALEELPKMFRGMLPTQHLRVG
ncbi:hypothetical protein AC579_8857 [Pseudocercospora musae]|uniref:RNA-dependent RNA polymerase n=1 Tax=Pseudocercospora musae TaxID=113226 RepID=A0A139IH13_9PEZI|nr:hypothetical protein AC579_8857 [Pseudocercospora musae]